MMDAEKTYTRSAGLWSLETFAGAIRAQGDRELADELVALVAKMAQRHRGDGRQAQA